MMLHTIYLLVIAISLAPALQAKGVLYTLPAKQFSVDQTEQALTPLIEAIHDTATPADNLIVYIHGRGRHPEKSLKRIIPRLEREYKAKVLMFNWPSHAPKRWSYPKAKAIAAAQEFNTLLQTIAKMRQQGQFDGIKTTLFAHSMGNYIVKSAVENYPIPKQQLFDVIVLNAADVSSFGHASWVVKMKFAKRVYITFNLKDRMLALSSIRNLAPRLGQTVYSIQGEVLPLAPKAIYIDTSETHVNHSYFLRYKKRNVYVSQFYEDALNGRDARMRLRKNAHTIVAGRIYTLGPVPLKVATVLATDANHALPSTILHN